MKKKYKVRKQLSATGKSTLFLAIALVLTLAVGIVSVIGMPLDGRGLYKLKPWTPFVQASRWPASVPLGLGLGGGVYVEYQPEASENAELDMNAALSQAVSILNARMRDSGQTDGAIRRTDAGAIRIELPLVKNIEDLLFLLSTRGQLDFSFQDEVFLAGAGVKSATAQMYEGAVQPLVHVVLDDAGKAALAEASTTHAGETMTVTLDGELLVSGILDQAITNGELYISGITSLPVAKNVASILRAGALPFDMTQGESGEVAATLGAGMLQGLIIAGLILALAAMVLFVLCARLGGVAAAWALYVQIVLSFFLMAAFTAPPLNLLGIAGIVLGIAAFAWVNLAYLRAFAAEVRLGRAPRGSAKVGFKAAWKKVWKVYAAALVVAAILLILPIPALHSFAAASLAGLCASLIATLAATRPLLLHIARIAGKEPARFAKLKDA